MCPPSNTLTLTPPLTLTLTLALTLTRYVPNLAGAPSAAASASASPREASPQEGRLGDLTLTADAAEGEGEGAGGAEGGAGGEGGGASKRCANDTLRQLVREGVVTEAQVAELWEGVKAIVAKTLVACQPMVAAKLAQAMAEAGGGGGGDGGGGGGGGAASTCFHVLGVDILLDKDLRPWLLEVANHSLAP